MNSYHIPNFDASGFIAGDDFCSVKLDVVDDGLMAVKVPYSGPSCQIPQDQPTVAGSRNKSE